MLSLAGAILPHRYLRRSATATDSPAHITYTPAAHRTIVGLPSSSNRLRRAGQSRPASQLTCNWLLARFATRSLPWHPSMSCPSRGVCIPMIGPMLPLAMISLRMQRTKPTRAPVLAYFVPSLTSYTSINRFAIRRKHRSSKLAALQCLRSLRSGIAGDGVRSAVCRLLSVKRLFLHRDVTHEHGAAPFVAANTTRGLALG